jgi:hypothetical protein
LFALLLKYAGVFLLAQFKPQRYTPLNMTEYGIRPQFTHLSTTNEKKEERRKLLAEVNARRQQNYQRYIRKLRDNLSKNKIDLFFD